MLGTPGRDREVPLCRLFRALASGARIDTAAVRLSVIGMETTATGVLFEDSLDLVVVEVIMSFLPRHHGTSIGVSMSAEARMIGRCEEPRIDAASGCQDCEGTVHTELSLLAI